MMQIRKFCTVFLGLATLLAFNANAQKVGDKFKVKHGGVKMEYIITSLNPAEAALCKANDFNVVNLDIPATVQYKKKEYSVTEVGYGHERLIDDPSKKYAMSLIGGMVSPIGIEIALKTVIIPDGVRKIDDYAFAGCKYLEKVRIPDSAKEIGSLAFYDCPLYASGATASAQSNTALASNTTSDPTPRDISEKGDKSATAMRDSDIDRDIPETSKSNENTFAFIISNENYENVARVDYAINDGNAMEEYCLKTLGIPKDNIRTYYDATLNNMRSALRTMQQIGNAYGGDASFIVYYAGHGIPDEKDGSSYLLPVDGDGSDYETGFSLNDFYKRIGEVPSKQVVVFMDACFSGALRGDGMLAAARGVAIKAKKASPAGNMVVISAAQGDETAWPYKEKRHGLFSYHLLKKLQETKGNASLGEIADYVKTQVSRKSVVVNGKPQTPTAAVSTAVEGVWTDWKLR